MRKAWSPIWAKAAFCTLYGIILCCYISAALTIPPHPVGESDEYMIVTIALEQHFSDDIRAEDVEKAYTQYPEFGRQWDDYRAGNFFIKSGDKNYTAYFPLYSVLVMPVLAVFKLLGAGASYAFACANALYFFLALLLVQKLPVDGFLKFVTVAMLGASPIIFYIIWPSAELVICALVLSSTIYVFSGNYKSAMLFYMLAATLNITIAPFCFFIYYLYFSKKNAYFYRPKYFIEIIKSNFGELITLFILNCGLFIPIAINIHRYGKIVTQTQEAVFSGIFDRFLAYWLDLNFGILPYFPLLFFIIPFVLLATRKKMDFSVFLGVITLIMLSFSIQGHINCGTTGLHRYLSWLMVMLLTGTVYYLNGINEHRLKIAAEGLLVLSCCYTSFIVGSYKHFKSLNYTFNQYIQFTPLASLVLDTFPAMYNPLYSTFCSRLIHIDGGENYRDKLPIIYYDNSGMVKKALVDDKCAQSFLSRLLIPKEDEQKIRSEIEKIVREDSGIAYVNFQHGSLLKPEPIERGHLYKYKYDNEKADRFLISGWLYPEDGTRSVGARSIIAFSLPDDKPVTVTLNLVPLHGLNMKEQVFSVWVNGEYRQTFILAKQDDVSFAARPRDGIVRIELRYEFPSLRPRIGLGRYTDDRLILVCLKSLEVS